MSTLPGPVDPVQRFLADMREAGAPAHLDGARITYEVLAVGGSLAGERVTTGVSVSEVQSWPMAPPHWIHLPAAIDLGETNSDATDCPPGWLRHSREFAFDMSAPPAQSWLRHVRGVLSLARGQVA